MTTVGAEHCCLCGIHLVGLKRRYQCHVENAAFARKRCKPSPFLFVHLTSAPENVSNDEAEDRQGVCIPCVNWKRRVETCGLKRTKQPMLQLDQLICYLMQPGVHPEPDHRCMQRLIKAARQPDNPYRSVFPVPVQTILNATKDDTFIACIKAWWEYNGHTEFFASGHEARRIRSVAKRGCDQDEAY